MFAVHAAGERAVSRVNDWRVVVELGAQPFGDADFVAKPRDFPRPPERFHAYGGFVVFAPSRTPASRRRKAAGEDDAVVARDPGFEIHVERLTKAGDNLEVDLSGSSVQARSSINCGPLDVKGAVGISLKMLIEQKAPLTSGCFRNIDIVMPPGTFVTATPPNGTIFMYWESSLSIMVSIYKALSKCLGKDAIAVRDLLVHRIEEYARHCGHADLLRERIDGRVGQ